MKFIASILIIETFLLGCGSSISEEIGESFPRVITPLGTIEGYYKTSKNGRRYEAYEGLPYAQPPIGELRFRVAKSISPWTGILMAKQFGPQCIQYDFFLSDPSHNVKGSEDCLFMNIYTPVRGVNGEQIDLLPVIFYIHGGAFQIGSSKSFKSEYLLDKNVTLVTINYRLGPLGFLSTEDEIVPGNMGLKDQVIALRWVKDNIESFGGDSSRITIIGHSAGGTSVHYHYLTNLTTGLFQRGMSLSGTALNCWVQVENSLEQAKKLATVVGCPTDDVQLMVNCLRARSAHQIVEAVKAILPWERNPAFPFGPVIEKGSGAGEFTFIDRSPIEILNSGQVQDLPWITGVVSEEGLAFVASVATRENVLKEWNDTWETLAPNLLFFNYTIPKINHRNVARLIRQHYLGSSPIDRSTVNQTTRMISDRIIIADVVRSAKLQAKVNLSPVRFYYFTYRGAHSASELMSGSSENSGVSHGDDEAYIFESAFDPTTTPKDREVQKELINLWVSFATEGTPNVGVEWPAVSRSTEELDYLHIAGPGDIAMNTSSNFGDKDFWQSVGL